MDTLKEALLMEKASNGNEQAYAEIYKFYQPVILRFVYKYVKSDDIAEELCQDVFVKLWEKRQDLIHIRCLRSYLFTIAKNLTLNILKRSRKDLEVKSKVLKAYVMDEANSEDQVVSAEYLAFIENVLNTMPAQSREVFRLCRQQDKSYQEASTAIGISQHSIKKHMVKSMKVLKSNVEKEFGISISILIVIFFAW